MESASIVEHVSISIDEKLAGHSGFPHCIFKVHEKLRNLNPDAYEPRILAIGPYHREKTKLKGMEESKLHYLKSLLERKEETSAERYLIAMREVEEYARKCYAEPVGLTSDEFVDMMLLDGCFIIELFLKYSGEVPKDENDPIFRTRWMGDLMLELILFENQLPFFVLLKLYVLIKGPNLDEFINIVLHVFARSFLRLGEPKILDMSSIHEVQHLLDLLHRSRCPDPFVRIDEIERSEWGRIQCASQLRKAGIKFKKAEGRNLFDITYCNGTVGIPHLTIDKNTEFLFRNLIAHEQYDNESVCYITDYCIFMDYLIDNQEDFSLLQRDGIITNCLSGDEEVCTMFYKLCYNICTNPDHFSYGNILDAVRRHCWKPRHLWMATLRRDFNRPWPFISFLGAVLLLLLTIIQIVFAVCSFFVHKS